MKTALPALLLALSAGCGRSEIYELPPPLPPPAVCSLGARPMLIDFGEVALHSSMTGRVLLSNVGGAPCEITGVALGAPGDPDFELPAGQPTSLTIAPGNDASLSVDFDAASYATPTTHEGTLTFQTTDPSTTTVQLKAIVVTVCQLEVAPAALDFGHVALGDSVTLETTLSNTGSAPCSISMIGIAAGSDLEFSVPPSQPQPLTVDPGDIAPVAVTFQATDRSTPHPKTGTLVLQTNDPRNYSTSVPLTAVVDIGCDLSFAPAQLDFGNVILNTNSTEKLALSNDGSAVCNVSGVALGSGTDPLFTLPTQPLDFPVAPGGTAAISVAFSASDSAPPHQRSGALVFETDNPANPAASVPLSAVIDTPCSEASQFIYTVDINGMFSQFDPTTLTFTDIAVLNCPDSSGPFDMAVDQNAVAWVVYSDGELFQVDTTTAACQATSFVPNQDQILQFGMGFVFDPTTNLDTLFVSGGASQMPTPEPLATIAFPSLALTRTGGTVSIGFPDLTGTGDGELWGFAPTYDSVTGSSVLAQLDPTSGASLATFPLPSIDAAFNQNRSGGWAMKFWGGSFWIFIYNSIYTVARGTTAATEVVANDGARNIVGAGVSTCAPVQ
jgi:hypothetical protein